MLQAEEDICTWTNTAGNQPNICFITFSLRDAKWYLPVPEKQLEKDQTYVGRGSLLIDILKTCKRLVWSACVEAGVLCRVQQLPQWPTLAPCSGSGLDPRQKCNLFKTRSDWLIRNRLKDPLSLRMYSWCLRKKKIIKKNYFSRAYISDTVRWVLSLWTFTFSGTLWLHLT